MIDPASVLAWVMLVGLLVTLPVVAIAGPPSGLGSSDLGWLVVVGITNSLGLFLAYRALRVGKVGLVAPIVSTEGAIAALLALAAGEGIPERPGVAAGRASPRGVAYAISAACSFGLTLYATAKAGDSLPVAWVLVPARIAGVLLFALPLAAVGRLQLTRASFPLVVATGLCEVLGVVSYTLGTRHGIAITSVLASQFATISVVAAYFVFRERITGVQAMGVAATVVGVAALSAIQA